MTKMRQFNTEMLFALVKAIRLWAGFRPGRILSIMRRFSLFLIAARRRNRHARSGDIAVPPVIIFSITMRCNLTCTGCYSRNFSLKNELSLDRIDRLFSEAESLGISLFVITGGEPFLYPGLLDLLERHPGLLFLVFNNATLLDPAGARRIGKSNNIIPLFSVEGDEAMTDHRRGKGTYRKVMDAMELLKKEKAFFGFSAMVTTRNNAIVRQDSFYDDLIRRGCSIGLLVGYVPASESAPLDLLLPSFEQRTLRNRVLELQQSKPLILMQMPEDEYERAGTCLAAGKGFVHINAHGYVEPCPFFHWSTHTVQDSSLKEALESSWLHHIRANTNYTEIPHKGCALFEHQSELSQSAKSLGVIDTETMFK
jgi:MoaA/NifB/PqqE/SkfB family radical SAM enzyme